MKKRKFGLGLSLVLAAGTILGACGASEKTGGSGNSEDTFSVAMVTDIGGVDDKSFNQSAWEGLKAFGAEHGLEKGIGGYEYLQSQGDQDYAPNLNKLAREKFDVIYGIGFLMQDAVNEIAQQQPESNFAIVDAVVEQPNVASITFKEHEGSFLVGVIAGLTTKTNKIGFVGGVEIPLIEKFETGFVAGVNAVNPNAKVDVQYSGAFDKPEAGQSIANGMYSAGVDIIYHASGATGNGVFKEAKDLKVQDPEREIFVIGVDKDQAPEGDVEINGEMKNVTLTSMVKRVDIAVQDLANQTKNGEFPGGELIEYGLDANGVSVAETQDNVSPEALDAVAEWTEKIKAGEITVPQNRDELASFSAN